MNTETKPKRARNGVGSGEFVRAWDRTLWGVAFWSGNRDAFLCGEWWHAVRPMAYEDEPCRALVFKTRRAARAWAKTKAIECKRHSDDWHFRAVRVRETVCPNDKDEARPC